MEAIPSAPGASIERRARKLWLLAIVVAAGVAFFALRAGAETGPTVLVAAVFFLTFALSAWLSKLEADKVRADLSGLRGETLAQWTTDPETWRRFLRVDRRLSRQARYPIALGAVVGVVLALTRGFIDPDEWAALAVRGLAEGAALAVLSLGFVRWLDGRGGRPDEVVVTRKGARLGDVYQLWIDPNSSDFTLRAVNVLDVPDGGTPPLRVLELSRYPMPGDRFESLRDAFPLGDVIQLRVPVTPEQHHEAESLVRQLEKLIDDSESRGDPVPDHGA